MKDRRNHRKVRTVGLAVIATVIGATFAFAETVSFQNGVNGYDGTVQIRITSGVLSYETGGSINDPDFVMCRKQVPGQTEGSMVFWFFGAMFGTTPGQIPPNATILSARFELRTCSCLTGPAPQHGTDVTSPGPMCLARMLDPNVAPPDVNRLALEHLTLARQWGVCGSPPNWCSVTSIVPAPALPLLWRWYDERKGDTTIPGPDFIHGDFDRPAGGFVDMTVCDRVESADVTWIVQEWANGAPNYGFVMFADTTNFWTVEGTGNDYHYPGDVTRRPRLVVDYTPLRTLMFSFQEGTNDYTGCSMLRVGQDGNTVLGSAVDVATEGAFLDGSAGPADPEFDALLKFESIFGTGPGQVPPGFPVVKAYLTLTTPPESNSTEARSKGPYTAHRMLVDVDWEGTSHPSKPFLWSEFSNADGPTVGDELGAALSSVQAMTYDGRAYFDVTSAVEVWRTGSPNYGLAVKPGTTDGWKIYWTSPSSPTDLRPQLIVIVRRVPSKPADLDGNTYVNGDDLSIFESCASGPGIPYSGDCGQADFDDDLDVDQIDFSVFQSCYSGEQVAAPACRE